MDEYVPVCSYCRGIETSAAFVRFVDQAISPAKHTWQYLSNRHLLQLLTKATAESSRSENAETQGIWMSSMYEYDIWLMVIIDN